MKKERFYQYSLIVIGFFWVIFGYVHATFFIVRRFRIILVGPLYFIALPEFFSYDAFPFLAIMFTGASFVLYLSMISQYTDRKPLKEYVLIAIRLVIIAGFFRFLLIFIQSFYLITDINQISYFAYRDNLIYAVFRIYLLPIFIVLSGFILLALVRQKGISGVKSASISNRKNRMVLVLIAAICWISAGIVNLGTKLKMMNDTRYSWQMNGSFLKTIVGIASVYVMEQSFYMLVGFVLFMKWMWRQREISEAIGCD